MSHTSRSRQPGDQESLYELRIGGQIHQWTYQQAFVHGHRLLKQQRYQVAELIFQKLAEVPNRGPRAHIMLAICKAALSEYKASRDVLDVAFSGELAKLASSLQDVIVSARMGFKREATIDLVRLANERRDLPTLCLWLGDMLESQDQHSKAQKCWKLAVKRDRPGGAVALAAHQQLRKASNN